MQARETMKTAAARRVLEHDRGVREEERGCALAEREADLCRDRSTPVLPDQQKIAKIEREGEFGNGSAMAFDGVVPEAWQARRKTEAQEIGRDRAEFGERSDDIAPEVAPRGIAVEQEDRASVARTCVEKV